MQKAPRLVDIASLAGVSIGTVDRVMHNRGRVAKSTRERVLKIASELGYERNIHASMLAGHHRTLNIGSLLPKEGLDPFWDQVHVGFKQAFHQIERHNVRLHVKDFDLFDPADFLTRVHELGSQHFDGLVVAPIFRREWSHLMNSLEHSHIPHVMINTLAEDNDESFLCYVGPDSYQSGRLAARLLALHCKRNDAVLMIPLEQNFMNAHHMLEKEKGFRDCFAKIAPSVDVVTCEFEAYNDPRLLAEFLSAKIQTLPNLKGIYTSASRIHKIAEYFTLENIHHIKLIGYDSLEDNLKFLNAGKIHYLINQNPTLMGYMGLINLAKFLIFKSIPPKHHYLPLDVILPENVMYYDNHFLLQEKMFIPLE